MFKKRFNRKEARAAIESLKIRGNSQQQAMEDMMSMYGGNRQILKMIAEVYNQQPQIGSIKVNYKDQKL